MEIRGFLNELDGTLSPEFLGKFSPDQAEKIKKASQDKKAEIQKALKQQSEERERISKLPIAQQINLEELQNERLKSINEIYSTNGPRQKIKAGKGGQVIAEHKNSLGFIFIGDSKEYSNDPTVLANAPKISMVVGGGLGTTYNPKTGELADIDAQSKELIGISSQFHLLSLTDIDVKGILPISTLKKRSSVRTEADALELYSNEIVIIRSLGRPYKSTGARTMAPGGVHIVSGMNTKDKSIKEPEPMVLGQELAKTLSEILIKVSDMNSILINMNEDILKLKISLIAHVHPSAPVGPPTPSVDLGIGIAPTIATSTVRNITNLYSNLINLELLKTNKLTPLSEGKFLSEFNRVN